MTTELIEKTEIGLKTRQVKQLLTETLDDHSHHHDAHSKAVFGFWIFVLSDCVLFATLFACYAVLYTQTFGGISINQVATLPYILVESLLILTCSFTYGLVSLGVQQHNKNKIMLGLAITFLFGLAFIALEFHQFANLISSGNSWQRSAFLSAYFGLVGIHSLHVTAALIWIGVLMTQISMKNITSSMQTRLACLGLFWHFLNIVWIFIFSIVYLMGAI